MTTNVVNSLKRLERAGAANSRTVEKLLDAADELGRYIVSILPDGWDGYYIVAEDGDRRLGFERYRRDGVGSEVVTVDHDREAALEFARAIAGGILGRWAEAVEQDSAAAEALAILDRAVRAIPKPV